VIVALRPAARGPKPFGATPAGCLHFGEATGHLFLIATPFAMLALVCVLFLREAPLRTTIQHVDEAVMDDVKVPVDVAR
jgi:hypothetical protein